MKIMPRKLNGTFGLIIIGSLISLLASCNSSTHRRADKEEKAQDALSAQEVRNLVAKWNANDNWDSQLASLPWWRMHLTSGVQEILDNNDERPLLVLSHLMDIVKQDDGSYFGFFRLSPPDFFDRETVFKIELDSEQYKSIVSQELSEFLGFSSQTFALIVKVIAVHSSLHYSAYTLDDPSTKYETYIQGDFYPLVIGRCLDIIFTHNLTREDMGAVNSILRQP